MGLTPFTLTSIAFKNVIGKALGWTANDYYVESKPINFNITSDSVWLDTISSTPATAVTNGVAVNVSAPMSGISETQETSGKFHAYLLTWPSTPPAGTDPSTGSSFAYNTGSLAGINSGDTVRNIIPDKFGSGYGPLITMTDNSILNPNDSRAWYLQFNAGVYYQDVIPTLNPSTASVYVYIGKTLKNQPNTPYSNTASSQTTVGGVLPSTSFNSVNTNAVFDMMFYPTLQPSFNSFIIQNVTSPYEVGFTQPSGSYTMSWTIANTSSINSSSINIYGITGSRIYGPTSNSGTISNTFNSVVYNVPTTLTYSITAQTINNIQISNSFYIKWTYGVYYGHATQSLLNNYGNFLSYQTNLTGNSFGNYTFPGGTTSFKYILVPDSFATISNILWNNLPVTMADATDGYTFSANNLNYRLLSFSNPYTVTTNYKIYRSKYKLTATMSNVIIS
jgi:hypothetical protein